MIVAVGIYALISITAGVIFGVVMWRFNKIHRPHRFKE